MVYGFGVYNYWDETGMAPNLCKFRSKFMQIYANFCTFQKIVQLQEAIIFTCNPNKNEDTRHELPKGIFNAKQDRKIWVIKIYCFRGITIT